jgi:hypothetical protein
MNEWMTVKQFKQISTQQHDDHSAVYMLAEIADFGNCSGTFSYLPYRTKLIVMYTRKKNYVYSDK